MAMATLQPVNHAYLLSIGRNAAAALLIQASLQSALLLLSLNVATAAPRLIQAQGS